MSVLVWVMSDGEHQDMIATCRAGDGKWLTVRWDYSDYGMIGFRFDHQIHADDRLAQWTEELEANGSVIISGPQEFFINTPYRSDERCVTAWWNYDLLPIVMSLELEDPADSSWDEECTLGLPPATGTHAAWVALTTKDPYNAKLSWGP